MRVAVALVGAPVAGEHIATLRVDADGVTVAYRKVHLGSDQSPGLWTADAVALVESGPETGVVLDAEPPVSRYRGAVVASEIERAGRPVARLLPAERAGEAAE